jgi:DNA polymerase-3 subunit epsilon
MESQENPEELMDPSGLASRWLLRAARDPGGKKPLVFLDTETTGFNPNKQEMISISMIDEEGKPLLKDPKTGEMVHELKIKPKNIEEAQEEALRINGYTEEAWKDAPTIDEVADQISDIISTHKIAGHNPGFDRLFIEADLAKAGKPTKAHPEMVDTMALSYMAGMPSQKLGFTADALGIDLEHAHTAYDDTEASRQIYHALQDPKKVQEMRQKMKDEHGGPNRGVMFFGMERSGDSVKDDKITHLTVADQHGRVIFDHGLSEEAGHDTDTMTHADAAKEVSDILRDNMYGGHNPSLDAAFVRKMLKDNDEKMYSPVLDTATLQHAYEITDKEPEGMDPREKALDEARVFAEAGHHTMGDQAPHKNVAGTFEDWAEGRSFRHPLPKDDPRRKRDFIKFRTLQDMAKHGLSEGPQEPSEPGTAPGADEPAQALPDARQNAQKALESAQRWFQAWKDRAQKHAEPSGEKVATAWLRSQLIAPVHENLRGDIWDGDKLKPKVRKKLLEIAAEFKKYLGIPLSVKDIYFTGSLANYNYTNESDIDLHLLVDFEEIDGEDLLRELFTAKKGLFNNDHDIFIGPAEVELYVQDVDEPHASTGVYSVKDNKWVQHPKHVKPDIDKKAIMTKARDLMDQIDTLIKHDASPEHYDRLKEKIKKMRTSGLQEGGEFSTENLAFKVLRRNGYLEKLGDAATKAFDEELSISS